MASFRLGPLKQSPNRRATTSVDQPTQPFSIDPSMLQVSLEQTQPPSAPAPNRQTSGKSSPSRGRCVKEYEEQLQQLQHENFNLKLRVFLLEERMGKALGRGDAAEIIKNNIELKVENETLKKSLTEKNELLGQASSAIEELESQQRASQVAYQAEKQSLHEQLQILQKELVDVKEAQSLAAQRVNSLNLLSGSTDESVDLYAQAFGSFVLNSQQLGAHCNHSDHHSKEEVDELLAKIAELESSVEGLRSEAAVQIMEMEKMKMEIDQAQPHIVHYRQRIKELEYDLSEQEVRIRQLEAEETEKDMKIECLVQQLDTRNHRTGDQNSQTHESGASIKTFDPDLEGGRVQELVERDKIIEEKQYQLEQQNKILVEIQITLDEKQKQIEELESALAERKKKVDELENSLSKAGRTLQGFVADAQKKDKEMELLKAEAKKKDRRIKDLTAELKEVKDMLNKAKWEAETSGREDNVKAMAEEENERLWAELEEKKRLLEAAEKECHLLKADADKFQALSAAYAAKDEALGEANRRYAALSTDNEELARQAQLKDRQLEQLGKQIEALRASMAAETSRVQMTGPSTVIVHSPNAASASESSTGSKRKTRASKSGHSPSRIDQSASPNLSASSLASEGQASSKSSIPVLVAETVLSEHHDFLGNLQQQLATLRDVDRCKDREITQLRQELTLTRQEVGDLSSKLLAQTATCRTHEASAGLDRLLVSSTLPIQHSTSSQLTVDEENALKSEQSNLRARLEACLRERQELLEKLDRLNKHSDSAPREDDALVVSLKKQLEAAESRGARAEIELNKLRADLKSMKKRQGECWHGSQEQQSHLRMYKKEVAILRKRLADSTNACDVLRTRLEEMADFLEEILNLSEQGLLNLSNWSAKRRQTLQHSILQSRELSRSLSQSLMIGVDSLHDSLHDLNSTTSSSVSASSWSVHGGESGRSTTGSEPLNSSRENLSHLQVDQTLNNVQCGEPDTTTLARLSRQLDENNRDLTEHKQLVDKLRSAVAHLEEQIKQRDVEIAWLNVERQKNAALANMNKSVQTEHKITNQTAAPVVSSTPYSLGPNQAATGSNDISVTSSFISPIVSNSSAAQAPEGDSGPLCRADRALVSCAGAFFNLSQSVNLDDTVKTPVASNVSPQSKKHQNLRHPAPGASESEAAWSEPDRNVSIARIGLSMQESGSLSASTRKQRAHSASALVQPSRKSESGDSSSDERPMTGSLNRRPRSEVQDIKKMNNRLRLLEQENVTLKSQLSDLVKSLRCTWNAHRSDGQSCVGDDSQIRNDSTCLDGPGELSSPYSPANDELDVSAGNTHMAMAQYIIDALQGRLVKMKESMKRKEQRLRESKDLITQLEFRVKEKYFKNCENESRLKEAYEKLQEKNELVAKLEGKVSHLELRWTETERSWKSELAGKELIISELEHCRDARGVQLRNMETKCLSLEKSLADSQNSLRQTEADLKSQYQLVLSSKTALEDQVRILQDDLEKLRSERQRLQSVVESLKNRLDSAEDIERKYGQLLEERDRLTIQLRNVQLSTQPCAQCQHGLGKQVDLVSHSERKNSDGLHRQLSQMSDYVSDHVEEADTERRTQATNPVGVIESRRNSDTRTSTLHLSPDLGIDSDPSRFSSLETGQGMSAQTHKAAAHVDLVSEAAWRIIGQGESLPKGSDEDEFVENGKLEGVPSSPDVLGGQGISCTNCQVLRKKYTKAKQTLAVTLEKLQAANLRKEKIDRALNRELGKTHNVLCQARGLLEHANASNKNKPIP